MLKLELSELELISQITACSIMFLALILAALTYKLQKDLPGTSICRDHFPTLEGRGTNNGVWFPFPESHEALKYIFGLE